MEQGTIINEVLNTFCVSSSKKINKKNTQIFFSKNVISAEACRIGKGLGFTVTKSLGNYIGMPLLHSRVEKNNYRTVLDKVGQRLSGWN